MGLVCPEIQTVQPSDNYTVPHVFIPRMRTANYLNIWTQSPDAGEEEAGSCMAPRAAASQRGQGLNISHMTEKI